MGPRSDNRGYGGDRRGKRRGHMRLQWVHRGINGGMGRGEVRRDGTILTASMGPRSDNRGYGQVTDPSARRHLLLQWVHGRITVVMVCCAREACHRIATLQWVHGRITVVMGPASAPQETTRHRFN